MAACDMTLITLEGWTEGEDQLVCVISPVLERIIPISGTLEDPDENGPVHIQACCTTLF